ncbi:metaphase chromosome protein 1 [Convivina intestini]|uniref:metaphase chromosome protein 1 n=1 Tax=Convivina intestini TaxID=1505726 RepID=UPI0020109136|nr:metaphase chromosome protein 1 [Convivina intestini]CAH1855959.1 hypothetical protein R078131_01301 [Convivina intestini]
MKQGKASQIKKIKHQRTKHRFTEKKKLSDFNFDEFVGFLRARYFLTRHDKFAPETYEVASFFLDDVLASMVQQNFSKFTSNERVIVNLNEVMQATLVNSADRDWRYFILLLPALYDLQKFLAQEGSVNDRFGVASANFDINFWRMIIRTVIALNYFRFQGKDVTELMNSSNAIDELQFKFLKVNGDDDDFDLNTIDEVFRGVTVKMAPLKLADAEALAPVLTADEVDSEIQYAEKRLPQFQESSIKGVVSENVLKMLSAYHLGLAQKYQAVHSQWTAPLIETFTTHDLMNYWTPQWDNLDGIGGEVSKYVTFLGKKKALTNSQDLVSKLDGLSHYIDVLALNTLLANLKLSQVQELGQVEES